MASLAAERKALLFSVGEVRLALRLSQVREIQPFEPGAATDDPPLLSVAVALGIAGGPSRFALATEGEGAPRLQVDALHGIVDLERAEVFQLPAATLLPQPPPFRGVLAEGGALALELEVSALGWAPIEPALDSGVPPAELDVAGGRELLFERGGRTLAVPLPLLVRVLAAPRLHPVPLAPPSHVGLAYHGRAVHPVLDPAVLYGDAPGAPPSTVLLVDAGGAQIGLAADAVLRAGATSDRPVSRPSWDALFAP
jgi:chemotaxis signal transduction protein